MPILSIDVATNKVAPHKGVRRSNLDANQEMKGYCVKPEIRVTGVSTLGNTWVYCENWPIITRRRLYTDTTNDYCRLQSLLKCPLES
jgi:hypothetical protein